MLFLGDVRSNDLPDLCRAVAGAAKKHAPFALRSAGLGAFPNLRRPRTLWVGVTDGGAEVRALHADLEDALFELGRYRREARPFTPHVTLGRVKGEGGPQLPAKADAWTAGVTQVREVLVMSSELRPDGPTYTVLGRGKLDPNRAARG
jgi:RNA 2',3'-cyclic 3'-phosphodiesterase